MKNRTSERVGQAGFTLLELLISLLLTSLLTVLIYGGLQVGMSSWEKVIDRNEEMSDAFLTQRFLRRLIEGADSELIEGINHEYASVGFLGLENELLFMAPLPRFESVSKPLWVYLSVHQDEKDIARLQLATIAYESDQPVDWELLLDTFRNEEQSSQYVLATAVIDQIEFQYMEIDEQGFSSWQSEWRFLNEMPAAVQVRFMSEDTVVRGWPDLIVTPREDAYAIRDDR